MSAWSRFNRLKIRMMLAFVTLSLIFVMVLWVYQQFFLETNYIKSQEDWLILQVQGLAQKIDQGEIQKATALLDSVFVDGGASVEWYDGQGNLIEATLTGDMMDMRGKPGMGRNSLVAPRLMLSHFGDEFLEKGVVLARGPFSRSNTEVIVYVLKLNSGGLVLATLPVTAIDSAINLMQSQLLWVSIFLGIIGMVLGALISTYITGPVALLESTVKQMATGDFSARVTETGTEEFRSLARSVNHMAEDLGKTDRLKDELIANVSHELRTPLGIIKGYAELLVDIEGLTDSEKRQHLTSISEEATHLGELVHALLDVSQIRAGTISLNTETLDLSSIVQDAVDFFEVAAAEKGVKLEFYREEMDSVKPLFTHTDPMRLRQILVNLLDNAIKFTATGGVVTVCVSEGSIKIQDSGIGISDNEVHKIWERHYRTEPSLKGNGIGLSLVKSLCDILSVKIRIESQLNRGTIVYLNFS